jgi:hypothetical protein
MNDAFDGLVLAPWDDDTVDALDDYQHVRIGHPYTCPRDHRDPDTGRIDRGEVVLDSTEDGFICPVEGCGYTQRWAHALSANRRWIAHRREELERICGWAGATS